MKISEAKTIRCPIIADVVNCICGDCMAWLPTKNVIGFSCPCGNTLAKYGEKSKRCDDCGTLTLLKVHEEVEGDGYCSRVMKDEG